MMGRSVEEFRYGYDLNKLIGNMISFAHIEQVAVTLYTKAQWARFLIIKKLYKLFSTDLHYFLFIFSPY